MSTTKQDQEYLAIIMDCFGWIYDCSKCQGRGFTSKQVGKRRKQLACEYCDGTGVVDKTK